MPEKPLILVVDDEREIADLIELYLQNDGFDVRKFYKGSDALSSIDGSNYDLALLDVMLPDVDGFTMLKAIREKYFFPVIMLTAKVGDNDKIMGLTLGADDYITKPFNPLEVTARVKTQLRRSKKYNAALAERSGGTLDIRGLTVDPEAHKCLLFGEEITLTPTEFALLRCLCENRGRVVSTEELFEKVWGEKYLNANNTVMAHIARLREKLHEPPRSPRFIKTVWGVGYKIE